MKINSLSKPDLLEVLNSSLCRRDFYEFVKLFWCVHHDAPMIENWHINAICEHLQAVYDDQIDNLILNVPPGFAKSIITSAMFPAWVWVNSPRASFLCVSNNHDIANRDGKKQKEIVRHPLYKALFNIDWEIDKKEDAKEYFSNTIGGFRQCKTHGQQIQGARVLYLITDDLIGANDAVSDKPVMEGANVWRDSIAAPRKILGARAKEVHIQQRLHPRDITGHLTTRDPDKWTVVKIPLEYDKKIYSFINSPLDWEDPRTEEGELLCPTLFTAEMAKEYKVSLQEFGFQAQYQQNPISEKGFELKRDWFSFWTDKTLPNSFDYTYISCDLNNLKKPNHTKDTDYAVIDVWAVADENYYLLEQYRERMNLTKSYEVIEQLIESYQEKITAVLIEKAANGIDVIEFLRNIHGNIIKDVSVQGQSKSQRVKASIPIIEPGRVFLPNKGQNTWVHSWLSEVCSFPTGAHDDVVDTMTLCLLYHMKQKQEPMRVISLAERLRQRENNK